MRAVSSISKFYHFDSIFLTPLRELGTYIFRAYLVMHGIGFFLLNISVHDSTINGRPLFKTSPCNAEHAPCELNDFTYITEFITN